jgi:hypothetical protein
LYRLSVDGGQAINQLNRIADSAKNVDTNMSLVGDAFKSAFVGLAAGFSVAAVVDGLGSIIDKFDDISKAAQKVGVSAEELQKLGYAAKLSDVSTETLQASLGRLCKGMRDISSKSTDAGRALAAIGVSATGSTSEALGKIADQFQKIPDGAQKTALATELFGKAGKELIPMLNGGAAGLKQLGDEAERYGNVINGNVLAQAEQFNDNLTRLQTISGGIGMQFTAGLLPALSAISDSLVASANAGDGFLSTGDKLGQFAVTSYELFLKLAATVEAFGLALGATAAIISDPGNAGTIFDAWKADVDALEKRTNELVERLRTNFDAARTAAKEPLLPDMRGRSKDLDDLAAAHARLAQAAKEAQTAEEKFINQMATLSLEFSKLGEKTTRVEEFDLRLAFGLEKMTEARAAEIREVLASIDAYNALSAAQKKAAESDVALINYSTQQEAKFKALIDSIDPAAAAVNKYAESQLVLQQMLDGGTLTLERYQELVGKLAAQFADSTKGTDQYTKALDGIANAVTGQVATGINNLIDSFGKAKFSIGDFVAAFVKDIAKMIAQILIIQPLVEALKRSLSGFGFFGGGAFVGPPAPVAKASSTLAAPAALASFALPDFGGIAKTFAASMKALTDQAARSFEAYTPPSAVLQPVARIEVLDGMTRANNAPLTVPSVVKVAAGVVVNVNNTAGVEVETTSSTQLDGSTILDIEIRKRVTDMLSNGSLDRTMRSSYGLRRSAMA